MKKIVLLGKFNRLVQCSKMCFHYACGPAMYNTISLSAD